MPENLALSDARARGDHTFMSGKPCRAGHSSPRYVRNQSCVECTKLTNRKTRARGLANDPAYDRRRALKQLFGLTLENWSELRAAQNDCCATCTTAFSDLRVPHVDHDHVTGKVRGLLCDNCNKALGMVKDNPETLQKMIAYLSESSGR